MVMRAPVPPTRDQLDQEIAELQKRKAALLCGATFSSTELGELDASLENRLAQSREHDETKRTLLFLRGRIHDLRTRFQATPPTSEQGKLGEQIWESEVDLRAALEINIQHLADRLTMLRRIYMNDPSVKDQIEMVEAEVRADTEEEKMLSMLVSPTKARAFFDKYEKDVRPMEGGGCMTAMYTGLGVIFTPELSKEVRDEVFRTTSEKTRGCDKIMKALEARGKASPQTTIKFSLRQHTWVPSVEQTVLDMVPKDFPGWYFFGFGASGGYHSVILAVDTEGTTPQIYFMDQYSHERTTTNDPSDLNNVTGRLDSKLRGEEEGNRWLIPPRYGLTDCWLWQILPPDMAEEKK
jgi:hypothetical protein